MSVGEDAIDEDLTLKDDVTGVSDVAAVQLTDKNQGEAKKGKCQYRYALLLANVGGRKFQWQIPSTAPADLIVRRVWPRIWLFRLPIQSWLSNTTEYEVSRWPKT